MDPQTEATVRLTCFAGVFLVMALAEWLLPRRKLTARKLPRWGSNLALVVLNTVAARFLIPLSAVTAAMSAQTHEFGLLNLFSFSVIVKVLLAVAFLDFAIYLQHVLFHAIPIFWKLHRVHHADLDLDVTSGLRFHTLEILLSALIKLAVIGLLGAPPLAVVIFEVVLNATAMFNHSNVHLPLGLDRVLRLVLVTPDMHRVHHSVNKSETNSNFGFNLPWWDYLFGTYCDQPALGHEQMVIGAWLEVRDESSRLADYLRC
ncbi:MAG: sterol desaturase family protein [Pirellulales bacterium]